MCGDFPLPSRASSTQHQPPVSYHANAHHAHPRHHPVAYNPMTIEPSTAFSLPSLPQTRASTAIPLLPLPFSSHLALQRPSPQQHQPRFQSDSDHTSLPSLEPRLPSHFIQPSTLQSMSNSQASASPFTSPPFVPSHTASVYQSAQPDTRDQPASSADLNPSFPGDECHRDVSIDVDMSGSHNGFNDGGNSEEDRVWNPDGRMPPLSPRNDVSQGGDARYEPYEPRDGQVGGGAGFDNYRLDQPQLCGARPLDATEAIAKAMAAQRGDLVDGYKMLPALPTFNLPNLNLPSRQEESDMTAGSRDNLPPLISCAAPPLQASTAGAQWQQLPFRAPHSPGADSGVGVAANTLALPYLSLDGRAAKEATLKRIMRVCLPRKEVCDHLVEHYVSLLRPPHVPLPHIICGCSLSMSSGVSPSSIDQRSNEPTNRSGSLTKMSGQGSFHP